MDFMKIMETIKGIAMNNTQETCNECKALENLILDFMNEWDRCGKWPDTSEELRRLNFVYDRMYEYIFNDTSKTKDNK